jgi:hypothetical protein
MEEHKAFTRNEDGTYHIDFGKALECVNSWAELVLTTQGDGNYEFAKAYAAEHANIGEALAADVAKVNALGIPRDIRFDFVW